MLDPLPTDAKGWAGWGAAAVVTAFVYLPKIWAERKGESREIERLLAALQEERTLRKEAEDQLDQKNKQINELIREFADIKAENAVMHREITYLRSEIEMLRNELKRGLPQ